MEWVRACTKSGVSRIRRTSLPRSFSTHPTPRKRLLPRCGPPLAGLSVTLRGWLWPSQRTRVSGVAPLGREECVRALEKGRARSPTQHAPCMQAS
jgi:hypothetical protein